MAIANYAISTVSGGWTQAILGDAIKAQLIAAGWDTATFDDYSASGERNLVFRLIHDASKTFGTTFLRIQISSALAFTITLGTAWNTTTKAMANVSTTITYSALATASPIRIHTLNAFPEFSGITLEQLSTFIPIFALFPSEMMAGYDLNSWSGCLVNSDATLGTWRATNNNPYISSLFVANLNIANMGAVNRISNRRDSLSGLVIFYPSNEGVFARTSDDIGQGVTAGLSNFNEMLDDSFSPVRRHLVLRATAGGMIARIA